LSEQAAHAGPAPLTGVALLVTAMALALGTFMQVLDNTVAIVSVPTIAGDLGASTDQGAWVITSFAVSNGISVPLTGWLMVRYGVVRTFVAAVALFTLASLLCGIAWNLPALIVFRVLQGAVSGPMVPGSQALLISIFPPERRGTGLAISSMTTLAAPIFGPALGGYISDNIGWPWIFLINLPVGILCALVSWRNLRTRETPTLKLPVDTVGFALLVFWVGAFQILMDTGKDADWFASPTIVVLTVVAVISFIAWLIWELTEKNPIVDLSLFRSRNFLIGSIAMCVGYGAYFGNNLLLPLWLQTHMNYLATWAGLVAAPAGVLAVVTTPLAARLSNFFDSRLLASFSLAMFGVSFWLRSGYTPDASFSALAAPMIVQGAGLSIFFMSLMTISLGEVPAKQLPQATGLSNFTRLICAAFAVSMTTTIWDRAASVHRTRLAETMSPASPAWHGAMHAITHLGFSPGQALGLINRQVDDQASLLGALDFFRGSAWIVFLLVPLVWAAKAPVRHAHAPMAAAD
jgi:DHA2 family multidrug resistance protein